MCRFSEAKTQKVKIEKMEEDRKRKREENGGKTGGKRGREDWGEEEKLWRMRREKKDDERVHRGEGEERGESLFTTVNKKDQTQIGTWCRRGELNHGKGQKIKLLPAEESN